MRYSNSQVDDERIYRNKFKTSGTMVTCVYAKYKGYWYFGFAVMSPRESSENNRLALQIARGRLRKAFHDGVSMIYPKQRWLDATVFKSIKAEIIEHEKEYEMKETNVS